MPHRVHVCTLLPDWHNGITGLCATDTTRVQLDESPCTQGGHTARPETGETQVANRQRNKYPGPAAGAARGGRAGSAVGCSN